jgi:hypothetical protein
MAAEASGPVAGQPRESQPQLTEEEKAPAAREENIAS